MLCFSCAYSLVSSSAITAIGSDDSGIYDYNILPKAGAKVTENTTLVSSYSYDPSTKELVSYDTPDIVKLKAQYIVKKGLAGGMSIFRFRYFWLLISVASNVLGAFGRQDRF